MIEKAFQHFYYIIRVFFGSFLFIYILLQIVKNIAAIGLAIGIPNKALDMIQTAREKPPTPSPEDDKV